MEFPPIKEKDSIDLDFKCKKKIVEIIKVGSDNKR